ncbi:MAG: hypothetical protein ACOX5M_00535 [Bacillota bacterium]
MLGRVKGVRRARHLLLASAVLGCVLLGVAFRLCLRDSGVSPAAEAFWKGVLDGDLVAVTAKLSPAADVDAGSLIAKYSGHRYKGLVKNAVKVERDISVVPVELKSPSGYIVSILTIMQKEGRDWRVRSVSTSR